MLIALILWSLIGRLDIVAVAEGKLIPQSYLKVVQPSEAGIVKEILVREGETVRPGQVLMRMDTLITEADAKSIEADYQRKRLTLQRIDAELGNRPFLPDTHSPSALTDEVAAQYRANRNAFQATLAEERSRLTKAHAELSSARQVQAKLSEILPYYRDQDKAFEELARGGFTGNLMARDKKRERIEKEQEFKTQIHLIESAKASISQSERKLAQIESDYYRQLHVERNEIQGAFDKLSQEAAKQTHRRELLELKAGQESIVKDLATHTAGTVVQPGTVLLTLIPKDDVLRAEVWVSNEDIGFVRPGQMVKLKFTPFQFQKYGMVEGTVEHVSSDSADSNVASIPTEKAQKSTKSLVYKALITLQKMHLELDGERFPLSAGMQTNAEILLGTRSVLEYILSPVKKAWHEAARER